MVPVAGRGAPALREPSSSALRRGPLPIPSTRAQTRSHLLTHGACLAARPVRPPTAQPYLVALARYSARVQRL